MLQHRRQDPPPHPHDLQPDQPARHRDHPAKAVRGARGVKGEGAAVHYPSRKDLSRQLSYCLVPVDYNVLHI